MVMIFDRGREALQELMQNAEKYAIFHMQTVGHCSAALFMDGIEGKGMFKPAEMATEHAKDNFAAIGKLVCVAHGADAVVLVAEAWINTPKPDQKLDLSIPPSQSPDRQEAVILMGESREGGLKKYLPICRSRNGKFLAFDEAHEIPSEQVKGRFAQFIPENIPSKEARQAAKSLLEGLGIVQSRDRGARSVTLEGKCSVLAVNNWQF